MTPGGGFGWLTRKRGLTVDNLVSAEIITASAERLRADEEQNADLLRAIRGSGGNLGVVTGFELGPHPVGPEVLSGLVVYPLDQASSTPVQYREHVQTIADELCVWAVLRRAPPLPFLPETVHGRC